MRIPAHINRCPVLFIMVSMAAAVSFADEKPAATLRPSQQTAVADVAARGRDILAVNRAIWEYAEVGLQEHRSSKLLISNRRWFFARNAHPVMRRGFRFSPARTGGGTSGAKR